MLDTCQQVESLVQGWCQQHHFSTFRQGWQTAQAAPQPGTKDLNLTPEYMTHRKPSTNEQVQNWIDQMRHVKVPGSMRVVDISLPAWDIILAGEQDSRQILGYVASSSCGARLLLLRNFAASMSLDTLSLGFTTSRGTHTAVGGPSSTPSG